MNITILVNAIATLMPYVPILLVLNVLVTMNSLLTVSLVTISMKVTVMIPALTLMEVTHVPRL